MGVNMEMRQEQQPRQRQRQRQGQRGEQHMTVDVQWRADITRRIEESAQSHQQTAIILERLKGQMDDHDRRIERLELAPDKRRQQFSMEGGCLGQLLFAALSGTAVLISIIGILAQHWK